jgi:hypothetical protein
MAEPDSIEAWPVELIPDDARLYLRVHVRQAATGLHPGIFREHGGAMSVDWNKYSTPEQSRHRAVDPASNGIVELRADGIRAVERLQVLHEPDVKRQNRAHSGVHGISDPDGQPDVQKTRVRFQLFERFNQWLITPDARVG